MSSPEETAALQAELAKSKAQLASMKSKAKQFVAKTKADMESLRAKVATEQATSAALRAAAESAGPAASAAASGDAVAALGASLAAAEAARAVAETTAKRMTDETAALKAKAKVFVSRLKEEKTALTDGLAAANAKAAALEQAHLDAGQQAAGGMAALEAHVAQCAEQAQQISTLEAAASASAGAQQRWEASVADANARASALEAQHATLTETSVAAHQQKLAALAEEHAVAIDAARQEAGGAAAVVNKAELDKSKASAVQAELALQQRVAELEAGLVEKNAALEAVQAAKAKTVTKAKELIDKLKAEKEAAENAAQDTRGLLELATTAQQKAEAELTDLKSSEGQASESLATAKAELTGRVAELEANIADERSAGKERAAALAVAQERAAAVEVAQVESETALEARYAQVVADATQAENVARDAKVALEERVTMLTGELDALIASSAGITAALKLKDAALASLEADTERAAAEVEATRKAHTDAAAESGDATAMLEARVGELEAALESKSNEAAETAARSQEALASHLELQQAQRAAADAEKLESNALLLTVREAADTERKLAVQEREAQVLALEEVEAKAALVEERLEDSASLVLHWETRVAELTTELETTTAASAIVAAALESKEAELSTLAAETMRAGVEVEATKKAHADAAAESGDATVMLEARVGELEATLANNTTESAETAAAARREYQAQIDERDAELEGVKAVLSAKDEETAVLETKCAEAVADATAARSAAGDAQGATNARVVELEAALEASAAEMEKVRLVASTKVDEAVVVSKDGRINELEASVAEWAAKGEAWDAAAAATADGASAHSEQAAAVAAELAAAVAAREAAEALSKKATEETATLKSKAKLFVAKMKDEKAALSGELEATKAAMAEQASSDETKNRHFRLLRTSTFRSEESFRLLRNEESSLGDQVESLRTQLADAQGDMQSKDAATEEAYTSRDTRLGELEGKVASLEGQLENANQDCAAFQNAIGVKESAMVAAQDELEQVRAMEAANTLAITGLNDHVRSGSQENERLSKRLQEADTRLQEQSLAVQRSTNESKLLSADMTAQIQQLTGRCNDLEANKASLSADGSLLQVNLEAAERERLDWQKRLADGEALLRSERSALQDKKKQTKAYIGSLTR